MVFNQASKKLAIALFGVTLFAIRLSAADAAHADGELNKLVKSRYVGWVKVESDLWGIDEAKILNESLGAELSAASRAKEFATQQLLSYSFREIKWPPNLDSNVVSGIKSSFLRVHEFKYALHGLKTIKSWKASETTIRSAVSLPEPEKQIPAIAYKNVMQDLHAALYDSNAAKLDLASYLEICAESDIPKVVEMLGEHMSRYGNGAAATFAGNPLQSAAEVCPANNPPLQPKNPSSRSEGLEILGKYPYEPAVCLALGNLMKEDGRPRAAQLLFSRGASVFVGQPAAEECKRKAGDHSWPLSFSFPQPELPTSLIAKLQKTNQGKTDEMGIICRLIVEKTGRLPIKASNERNSQYQEALKQFSAAAPNLTNALQCALRSMEEAVTADAANLAGRIFMIQGKYELAVPFLEQARFLEPNHPYAQANLALVLHALGEKTIAAKIAVQAISSDKTPEAQKKKLKDMSLPQ